MCLMRGRERERVWYFVKLPSVFFVLMRGVCLRGDLGGFIAIA